MDSRAPSGLFPSGPPRPTYREPHPVRFGAVMAGGGAGAAWMLFVGLLGTSTQSYVWLTIVASLVAAGCAGALARFGDRGVAVGVAIITGLGLSVAMGLALQRWITTGWPL